MSNIYVLLNHFGCQIQELKRCVVVFPKSRHGVSPAQPDTMMNCKTNMLDKFSFGPSQEDEGRKKTVHSTEGSYLIPHHVCPIDRAPAQRCQSRATWSLSGRAGFLRAFYFHVNRCWRIMVYEIIEMRCVTGKTAGTRLNAIPQTFSEPLLYKENVSWTLDVS